MQFNREQQAAVEANNNFLIISAAAGSGKTTVLVEKILQSIKNGHDLGQMLIITFTREAASNMRIKLKEKLEKAHAEDPSALIANAIDEVDCAQISTIHSFCSTILRSQFHKVGIDPLFAISEGNETQPIFDEAFRQAINELLSESTEPGQRQMVQEMLKAFTQADMLEMVRQAYHRLMGLPDSFSLARRSIQDIDQPEDRNPWIQEIKESIRLEWLGMLQYMESGKDMMASPDALSGPADIFENDLQLLQPLFTDRDASILEMKKQLENVNENMAKMVKPRKITSEQDAWYKEFKELRDTVKAGSKGIVPETFDILQQLDVPGLQEDHVRIKDQLLCLIDITEKTAEYFFRLKNQVNLLDFEDLEQLTYRLLTDVSHPDDHEDIQKQYTDIYVDECQDISAIQNAIIQALHSEENTLCMVGDVKQSIYRFRHADPSLFLYYRDHASDAVQAHDRRIFFRTNYRSSWKIIEAVNQVFQISMKRKINELDYEVQDQLVYGEVKHSEEPVQIELVQKEKGIDPLEAECVVMAGKISELLLTTFEDDQGKIRNYRYSDMAILMRSASEKGPKVAEYLKKLHIPVFYDGGETYYGLPEIKTMVCLLQLIDNFYQDLPLIATMRMVAFRFTNEEIAAIRARTPGHTYFYEAFEKYIDEENDDLAAKCIQFKKQIKEWNFLSRIMKLSDYIWYLLRESSLYAYCGSFKDGALRQANLRLLCQKADDFDAKENGTFGDFVNQLTEVSEVGNRQKNSDSISYLSETDDVIRVMTMHKSKGLEFPVVILLNINNRFMVTDTSSRLKMDLGAEEDAIRHLGMYLPKVNAQAMTMRHTIGKTAFQYRGLKNELAEQARLLYVAMTRAMNTLILIGQDDEKRQRNLWETKVDAYRIWNTRSMQDFVMPAAMQYANSHSQESDNQIWQITVHPAQAIPDEKEDEEQDKMEIFLTETIEKEEEDHPDFIEEEDHHLPIKTTVSSIAVRNNLIMFYPDSKTEENEEEKRRVQTIVPMVLPDEPDRPEFLEDHEISAAEVGTQTHRFLSLAQYESIGLFNSIPAWLQAESKRMLQQKIFSEKNLKNVNMDNVAAFYMSNLGIRMRMSDLVRREWGFSVLAEQTGGTIIQGMIDLAFLEKGQWVIVDYKTDVTRHEKEFVNRHAVQINLYRCAIERLTDIHVSEMWLFSLYMKKALKVPEMIMPL